MRPLDGEVPFFVHYGRNVDVSVISDTHLWTYNCHAKELLEYLDSTNPKILILNGDIIDFWSWKKWTRRQAHTLVIKRILVIDIQVQWCIMSSAIMMWGFTS